MTTEIDCTSCKNFGVDLVCIYCTGKSLYAYKIEEEDDDDRD